MRSRDVKYLQQDGGITMKLWTENETLRDAMNIVSSELKVTLHQDGHHINWITSTTKTVRLEEVAHNTLNIYAKDIPHVLQAIFKWGHGEKLPIEWTYSFERNGLMVDNGRNAVVNVQTVKYLLRKMAIMGHTWYMLYMEDNYEIPEQPYFGLYRGRYSQEDLKELTAYATKLGIELVPCIQTLAHLNQFLEWEHINAAYGDIDDILNVGRTQTKELIRQMLQSLRACFTTETIHLGMDEAYNLGRGSYMNEFGLRSKTDIMKDHLHMMLELCEEIGFKPMIWDDMFFSWYNQVDNASDFKVPDGIELMYWDYYNIQQSHYEERIDTRRQITQQLHFAGGAWRWTGYVPHHRKTLHTSIAALAACKAKNVEKVIATAWGDDSSEAPFYAVLFGLTLYALLDSQEYDEATFDQWLQAYTNMNLEQWLYQGEFDLLPEFDQIKGLDVTTSKYLLYQDLLMPRFMDEIQHLGLNYAHKMVELYNKFDTIQVAEFALGKQFYKNYAKVLEIKWNLPYRIWYAYHQDDREALAHIAEYELTHLYHRLDALCESRRQIWLHEANPQGLEIIEQRFGSMMMRAKTTASRLLAYVNGEVTSIPELEEARIDGNKNETRQIEQAITYNRALRIMSRSRSTW